MDVAGVVEAVGADVDRFVPGDEVVAMLGARFGGHAQYAVVPQDGAIALRTSTLSAEDAVALVFGGLTAHGFLQQARLQPGCRVLVNGASGAVGTAAVQLARIAGAHVTAVARAEHADQLRSLGASRVIDYRRQDFATDGATYAVVMDCVGDAPFERAHRVLRPGGTLLLVVADLKGLLTAGWRSRSRRGVRVRTNSGTHTSHVLAVLVALAEAGHLRPVRDRTFDLADIARAHSYVDTGKCGSVVVRISSDVVRSVAAPDRTDGVHHDPATGSSDGAWSVTPLRSRQSTADARGPLATWPPR
jgi:NADPH:quinone reductase-like Zn-dependent oxidoreductase